MNKITFFRKIEHRKITVEALVKAYDEHVVSKEQYASWLNKFVEQSDLQKLTNDIYDWAISEFKNHKATDKLKHLSKEVEELEDAILHGNYDDKRFEFADCLSLLLCVAKMEGFTVDDLIDSTKEKLLINKTRKWNKPDENGIITHVK